MSRIIRSTVRVSTGFKPQVRSRHPTHEPLKTLLPNMPFRSVIRLGSTTSLEEIYANKNLTQDQLNRVVEINTVDAIENSSNKLKMKTAFAMDDIKTADWFDGNADNNQLIADATEITNDWHNKLVIKALFGSRGEGNTLVSSKEGFIEWLNNTSNKRNYIFERFYNFNKEYRLHVTEAGCFYTCRKMLRSDIPEDQRWFRNDSNSVWIMEDNLQFEKPNNWQDIKTECVKALKSVGLDIGGFDVKVQSTLDNPEFLILESNSACSHGEVTSIKYLNELPELLRRKYNLRNI